jgi:hypothetical protein
MIVDIGLFMQWLNARAEGNSVLEEFYHQRFRPEFRPAFEAWIAHDPAHDPSAPPTPFNLPEYRLAELKQAQDIDTRAADVFSEGQEANTRSDKYTMDTVVFGMVLFFSGMAQQFEDRRISVVLLAVSAVMSIIGLYNLAVYPVAP